MLHMSPAEIAAKFRRNGCTANQIEVLADLNGCSKTEIIKALLESGVNKEDIPKMKGINKKVFNSIGAGTEEELSDVKDIKGSGIPQVVFSLCRDRATLLSQKICELHDEISKAETELEEITLFLRESGV